MSKKPSENLSTEKVWVTKYVLTDGFITEVDAVISGGMAIVHPSDGKGYKQYFHGKEWHDRKDEAILRAEDLRRKKIAALRRSIEKIEAMRFD